MHPGEVVGLLGVLPEEGVESPPGGRVVLVTVPQVPLPCTVYSVHTICTELSLVEGFPTPTGATGRWNRRLQQSK